MKSSKAKIRDCPHYEDLIWKNLQIDKRGKFLRRFLMWTLTAGLTLGWTAVISFISGLADLQKIGRFAPKFAASVSQSQTAIIILESIIAPGLIVLSLVLLQLFLYYASLFQGIASWNGVYKSVLIKFYFFQIYQFFLFITLSTTWEYFQNPNLIKDIRKSAVTGFIRNSTFYINYTIINLAGYCMEILQGNQLFIIWFYNKFFSLTPRDVSILNKAPELQMSFTLSTMLVLFLFCISYSVVAPLIVPFAVIIFGLAYVVFKYQHVYVYQTRYESGGGWWPKTFNLLCFSVGFFQLMTGGSIYILTATASNTSNGRIAASLVFLQICLTVFYWYYITSKFEVLTSSIETTIPPDSKFNLNEFFYHPAIGDPLEKVWVKNEHKERLSLVYTPKYQSVIDYMRSKGIQDENLSQVLTQRSKAFGNRHRNDINPGTSHPPEILVSLVDEF